MSPHVSLQITLGAAGLAFLFVLFAESMHLRRIDAVARLATGPIGDVRYWVRALPVVRAVAAAAMTWGLTTLFFEAGGALDRRASLDDAEIDGRDRVVFVADLSPSMQQIDDAGPEGDQTRLERMHDVVDALLQRIDGDVLFGVDCFYTESIPAIVDAEDSELVRNIFNGLPVWYVMHPQNEDGVSERKTDLGLGVRGTLEQLRANPRSSTTVFICTDGDTLPIESLPKRPGSVRAVYVLGVGDPKQGTFIDDHMSRQDASVLSSLAARLGGRYIDVNEKHVPTSVFTHLARGGKATSSRIGLVELAIIAFATGAAVLALLPIALALFGSEWKVQRPRPRMETA